MKVRTALAAAAAATLVAVPSALAHVTANPGTAPAGSFAKIDFRVPNERDTASTRKVTVRFPEGVFFVSFKVKPGWTRTIRWAKVDPPASPFGAPITKRIASVTWSGGRIRPNEFDEFSVSMLIPSKRGTTLLFPTTQFYGGGEVVTWGDARADGEHPAPRVRITKARSEG
ncbi:MAG TPA: YcnI family protein [Miltoncostaea sp.]|nr:YcnI family protein [Miltoncostaea sp.]